MYNSKNAFQQMNRYQILKNPNRIPVTLEDIETKERFKERSNALIPLLLFDSDLFGCIDCGQIHRIYSWLSSKGCPNCGCSEKRSGTYIVGLWKEWYKLGGI